MLTDFRAPRCTALVTACALTVLAAACKSPTSPDADFDPTNGITLPGGSTLVFEDAARLTAHRPTIERVVSATVDEVRRLLPVDGVTIIARAGTAGVIPEIGIGGRAEAGTVRLTFDPDSAVLAASLDSELFPLLAHELHHTARMRTVGYGNHLLGAMISEGLADQFAVEVAAIAPPMWSRALSPAELSDWTARAREQWFDTGYNHDAWFFGVGGQIPRWAGYSIGFELTRRFLHDNPARLPSQLYSEPATSFIPAGAP